MVTLLNNGERRNKMRKFMVLLMVCSAFGLIGCDNGTTSTVNGGNENQGGGGNQPQTGTITIIVTGIPPAASELTIRQVQMFLSRDGQNIFPRTPQFLLDVGVDSVIFHFDEFQAGEYYIGLIIGNVPNS